MPVESKNLFRLSLPRVIEGATPEHRCKVSIAQEWAALALCHYQVCHQCQPLLLAGDEESISVRKFLRCRQSGLELSKKCCFALAKICIDRQHATGLSRSCRYCIPPLPPASKRLAGCTTPFILKYSTICP
jgi:hypothetical protein